MAPGGRLWPRTLSLSPPDPLLTEETRGKDCLKLVRWGSWWWWWWSGGGVPRYSVNRASRRSSSAMVVVVERPDDEASAKADLEALGRVPF